MVSFKNVVLLAATTFVLGVFSSGDSPKGRISLLSSSGSEKHPSNVIWKDIPLTPETHSKLAKFHSKAPTENNNPWLNSPPVTKGLSPAVVDAFKANNNPQLTTDDALKEEKTKLRRLKAFGKKGSELTTDYALKEEKPGLRRLPGFGKKGSELTMVDALKEEQPQLTTDHILKQKQPRLRRPMFLKEKKPPLAEFNPLKTEKSITKQKVN
ncbi:hypothetical protein RSOL_375220, partial [Rhizoctonia solani AG-3 Rhs1AP]